MRNTLDLGLIGNCHIGALIDGTAEIVWCCLPRFDGDPVFCSLLREHGTGEGFGYCTVELVDQVDHRSVLSHQLGRARNPSHRFPRADQSK